MGGPDVFGVRLDGGGVHFCGQHISGTVIIQTDEELTNIKTVTVKLKGEGDVHWTERHSRTRDGKTEHYTEHYRNSEVYIKSKHLLHTGNVPAGHHAYPFSFLLPGNLPCSFEGKHGNVRYRVQAKLDRKGFFTFDKKTKQFITVNALVDLNQMPSITEPLTRDNTKTFGCLCCTTGPLSSTVNLPRTGYAPGETIPVYAEIENLSDKEMNKTQAILKQTVEFHSSRGKSKTIERTIQEVRKGHIGPGGSESWEGVEVKVPSVPPTGLGGRCSIMSIYYELEFRVDPSGIGFDLVTKIPITIGTIPLRAVFQSWPSYTGVPAQKNPPENVPEGQLGWVAPPAPPPTAPSYVPPSAPPIPLEGFDDLPPPTYEQAISADEDGNPTNMRKEKDSGEGIEGNWDYHPVYPIWPSAPPPPPK